MFAAVLTVLALSLCFKRTHTSLVDDDDNGNVGFTFCFCSLGNRGTCTRRHTDWRQSDILTEDMLLHQSVSPQLKLINMSKVVVFLSLELKSHHIPSGEYRSNLRLKSLQKCRTGFRVNRDEPMVSLQ